MDSGKSEAIMRTQAADSTPVGDSSPEFDDPPEYDMLSVSAELEPDTHPLDYDIVPPTSMSPASVPPTYPREAEVSEHHKGSMIAEAPPSYREIFGVSKHTEVEPSKQTAEVRRWRRTQRSHTISRSESAGSASSVDGLFGCFSNLRSRILVIIISLIILTLPLSMVIVGSINMNVCISSDIPLYLLIAGSCLSVEVFLHTFTVLASISTQSKTTLKCLRICDCFGFFILVWILIGSNWMFKVSTKSRECGSEELEDVANITEQVLSISTPTPCEDCSKTVYQFAVGLIIIQYIIVLSVLVACCCLATRKRTS